MRLAGDEALCHEITTRIAAAAEVLFDNPKEVESLSDWLWTLTTDH